MHPHQQREMDNLDRFMMLCIMYDMANNEQHKANSADKSKASGLQKPTIQQKQSFDNKGCTRHNKTQSCMNFKTKR